MKKTKGIVLAGGRGTRLYPMTQVVSKQLLPIYDKPMIYYPLSVLLLAGIRDILIISNPEDKALFERLLGDGSRLGVNISYKVQDYPRGLADAFIIGKDFIGADNVCLILGDNIFYGQDLTKMLNLAMEKQEEATIFGYPLKDVREFGVVEFNKNGKVISIEEKPDMPKSNYAIPGLYFYDNQVTEIAKNITPSLRGELEIGSINNEYLRSGKLNVFLMGRGMTWLDTGTPGNIKKASDFVETIQSRQGFYIACIEEIAWRRGFINAAQLAKLGNVLETTEYGKYILSLISSTSYDE